MIGKILCFFDYHDEVETGSQNFDTPHFINDPPEPKDDILLIEQKATLHQIDAIKVTWYKCKRCDRKREEQRAVRTRPPIEVSRWIEWPLKPGYRIVLPKNYKG